MGLSSILAPGSIAKPGVCTSSTRPASPYEGQVIYETDTDKTLVWNGSAWVFLSTSTANPVGLEFIKSQVIGSGVSSVEVTSAFSSTYDSYMVSVTGTTVSANQPDIYVQIGSATTNYQYGGWYIGYSAGVLTKANNATATYIPVMSAGNATLESFSFSVMSPNLAQKTYVQSNNGSTNWATTYNGYLNNTTQYTAFTLAPTSGTLTGGTIRVYGYRNS